MQRILSWLLVAAMAVCTAGCAILGPKADERPLDGMTVEEKIGQLLYIGLAEQDVAGNQRWISRLQPGGIILFARNFSSLEQTIAELNAYRQNADLSIPLFVGTDQEGGMVSRLPSWATQFPAAASVGKHPTLAGDLAQAMGKELAALGINMNFAPVLDINSNPANPVIGERAFGDKPEVVATVGLEVADGLQAVGVVPVVKHFPGHGDTIADSHYQLPVINSDMAQLERRELKPFREAVSRGVPAIMLGHLLVPALDAEQPASLSASVITGLLREEWGYQGVVITDDLQMGAITQNKDIGGAAIQAILAGADMLLVCHDSEQQQAVYDALLAAVQNGRLPLERLDQSVQRILELKNLYQVNADAVSVEQARQVIGSAAHRQLAASCNRKAR